MGGDFAFEGTFDNVWSHFLVFTIRAALVTSRGWKPGIMLNNLQCTGLAPAARDDPAQNVKSAEVEKLLE